MKKVVLSLIVFLIACNPISAKETRSYSNECQKYRFNFFSSKDEFVVGKVINGEFVVTFNKEQLIKDVEMEWLKKGYNYDLVDVKISETIPINDNSMKFYILHLFSENKDVNVAYFLRFDSSNFYLRELSFAATVSCTSTECQFGCAPASLIDPKTRKPVLTCSSCTNQCTKTATAGG